MSKILGNNVTILATTTVDNQTEQVPIAYGRSCEVDTDKDFQEVSSPSTGQYKQFRPKRSGWTMSVSCLLSNDEEEIMAAYNNNTLLDVYFTDSIGFWYWYGKAYIKSIKATGPIDQMASFQVNFKGSGDLDYNRTSPL